MHPQLMNLLGQLDAATSRATDLANRDDERAFHRRPPSGGWSAAECIAHLTLTNNGMLPPIDAALAAAHAGVSDHHRYRRGFVGGLLAWTMEPPARMRMPTTAAFVPASGQPREVVLREFEQSQREVATRIERASGLNIDELRVVSPFNARVKYNVYAAFCLLLAHERRHLWQAERALA
jgi:hypothetical protein